MRKAFSILAFIGLLLSLLAHLMAFLGVNLAKYVPWVWWLHIGIFVLTVPLLFTQGFKSRKTFWREFNSRLPSWARRAYKALFLYAIVNFVIFGFLSSGGVPDVCEGKYVLENHGTVIREISKEEYERQKAYVLRLFSGGWMVFYLFFALSFWYRKGRAPED